MADEVGKGTAWLRGLLQRVGPSAITIVATAVVTAIAISTAGYYEGARQADRDAKLEVLHQVAGYRFLSFQAYSCRQKDQLIIAMNQATVVFADYEDVIHAAKHVVDANDLGEAQEMLEKFIRAMAKATGVTPPPDSTVTIMTRDACP